MVIIYHLKSTATTSGTDQFDFGNPFWWRYRSEEISPGDAADAADDADYNDNAWCEFDGTAADSKIAKNKIFKNISKESKYVVIKLKKAKT